MIKKLNKKVNALYNTNSKHIFFVSMYNVSKFRSIKIKP